MAATGGAHITELIAARALATIKDTLRASMLASVASHGPHRRFAALRASARVYRECEAKKIVLSTVDALDVGYAAENILSSSSSSFVCCRSVECLVGDKDFHMRLTRAELVAALHTPLAGLRDLVADVVAATPLSAVRRLGRAASLLTSGQVELVGGVSRAPFMRAAIADVTGADCVVGGRTLDGSGSVAIGCAAAVRLVCLVLLSFFGCFSRAQNV